MDKISEQIFYDEDHTIFITNNSEVVKILDRDYTNVTRIPTYFLTKPIRNYIDVITVKMLASDMFVIYIDQLNNLRSSNIKEFVSDDFFHIYRSILNINITKRNKLIIVTNDDPANSIFTDAGLKRRTVLF